MKSLNKIICSVILLSGILFLFPSSSYALKIEDVPNPRQVNNGWVTDMADLLSPEAEAKLNRTISDLEAKNGTEIAVITVAETKPYANPKEFATKLFNYWGIGKKEKNNGILLLVSQGDRRVEIETGYGIVPILSNDRVQEIIDREIIPKFKQGKFETGIINGTNFLIVELEGEQNITNKTKITNYIIAITTLGGIASLLCGLVVQRERNKRKLFLAPNGTSNSYYPSSDNEIICCAKCEKPMQEVSDRTLLSHLTKPKKVALKLGAVTFKGWQCNNCFPNGESIHIRRHRLSTSIYNLCPTCNELIVKNSYKELVPATKTRIGKRQLTQECQCCNYFKQIEQTIPTLAKSSSIRIKNPSSYRRSSSNYSSSSDSCCSSYSGGDSIGSSFGGGSSGGDGGGGDW